MCDVQSLLQVKNLTVHYGQRAVLSDLTLQCRRGEILGVMGPNGAGKSTLLQAVLGLVRRTRGRVLLGGELIARGNRRIAYVPQRDQVDLDFPVTALEVVAMGLFPRLGMLRPPRRRDYHRARMRLEQVGLGDRADSRLGQLSGGQQQRVFLARALAQGAELFLLDEPLSAVDADSEQLMLWALRDLRERGCGVLLVGHDFGVVRHLCDRVLLLNRRRIACGTPAEVLSPRTVAAAYGGRRVSG